MRVSLAPDDDGAGNEESSLLDRTAMDRRRSDYRLVKERVR